MQKKVYNYLLGKTLITVSFFLLFNFCASTNHSIDAKYGKMSKIEWFQETNSLGLYQEYEVAAGFKINNIGSFSFDIFASTECSHCISELAALLKILERAGASEDRIHIYNVNDDFEESSGAYKEYNIYSVPTLFIKKNGILKGKSEGPIFTWENDLIKYCNE